ncbi:MAG: DUF401 family protein [Candidatus Thermoplasmatota archaeon]|nr:DUF401 family protein [Candidatus Thermoplasmatota archaeon]
MLTLIGVLVAFAVIVYLIRRKFNFGISLIIGSLIVGIFSLQNIGLPDIIKAFIEAIIYNFQGQPLESIITSFDYHNLFSATIELALLMTLIFMLAKMMQLTGAIKKLIDSLRTIFSKGGALGIVPAIYGLMPVPGGALFSAPTIEEEGNKFNISKIEKNFLNVWFRHIWFAIYPISSAMILICGPSFSNINIYFLVLINFPAFFTSIFIGYYYLKKFLRNKSEHKEKIKRDYSGLIYLLPPLLPLVFYWVLIPLNLTQIQSFLIGVIFSILLLYLLTKSKKREYFKIMKKSLTINLALAIFGIMIFREMFEVSGATKIIADIISDLPFPSILIIIFIPIILGVLTGYNLGAVSLSYPLVSPFFQFSGIQIAGLTSIIFISSLVGYLISPIHLCNVLSSEYLKTDTTRMYKMYIPSAITMLIVQTVFVIIIFRI